MDQELLRALGEIKKSSEQTETNLRSHMDSGIGRLEGKVDMMNKQFNQHLIDDTKEFTVLQQQHKQLSDKLSESEQRRKEDSDRRINRIEADKVRSDQWRIAKYAGIFALAAAILGALVTSLLTYAEQKASRVERAQQRIDDRK